MWYYVQNEQQMGPVDEATISALIRSRTVSGQTLVWCEGMAQWLPASQTSLSAYIPVGMTPPPPGVAYPRPIVGAPAPGMAQIESLYDPVSVSLATFLGSPIAGAILMSINFRRAGQATEARNTLVLGFLGTLALVGISFFLPSRGSYGYAIIAIEVVVTRQLCVKYQGGMIEAYYAAGSRMASRWAASGIGCLVGLCVFVVIIAVSVAMYGGH